MPSTTVNVGTGAGVPVVVGAPFGDTRLMGDLNITSQTSYRGGISYSQAPGGSSTTFEPAKANVVPPAYVPVQVDSIASTASSGLITTILRVEAGVHGTLHLHLVPDFVTYQNTTNAYLIEAYCDGNVRTEPYFTDASYLFMNESFTPYPSIPEMETFPNVGPAISTPFVANSTNYIPLEYLANLPGCQFVGRIDGYSVGIRFGNISTSNLPICINNASHVSSLLPISYRSVGSMGFSMSIPLREIIGTSNLNLPNTSGPLSDNVHLLIGDVALQTWTPAGAGTQSATTAETGSLSVPSRSSAVSLMNTPNNPTPTVGTITHGGGTDTVSLDTTIYPSAITGNITEAAISVPYSASGTTQMLAPYRLPAALINSTTNTLIVADTSGGCTLYTRTSQRDQPDRVPIGRNFGSQ
jgi:hypothetical protein